DLAADDGGPDLDRALDHGLDDGLAVEGEHYPLALAAVVAQGRERAGGVVGGGCAEGEAELGAGPEPGQRLASAGLLEQGVHGRGGDAQLAEDRAQRLSLL